MQVVIMTFVAVVIYLLVMLADGGIIAIGAINNENVRLNNRLYFLHMLDN